MAGSPLSDGPGQVLRMEHLPADLMAALAALHARQTALEAGDPPPLDAVAYLNDYLEAYL